MANLIVVLRVHKLSKFLKHVTTLSWVEYFVSYLKCLNLKKQWQKLLKSRTAIYVHVQHRLKSLLTPRELVHGAVVYRIALHNVVLLCQDLTITT